MNVPRLRMVAGPNGSGKSTLLEYLRTRFSLPMGYCLNPDLIEHEIAQTGRLELCPWGIRADEAKLRAFVRGHALGGAWADQVLSVQGDLLTILGGAQRGYLAAIVSDYMRRQWLSDGQSFTFETVMSSRDKVDLLCDAERAGYRTYLYYICTSSPTINRERVATRVLQGGHDVPAAKIEPRYQRSLALLPEAIRRSTRAYLFDNSGRFHRLIAEFNSSKLVRVAHDAPAWFVGSVLGKVPQR